MELLKEIDKKSLMRAVKWTTGIVLAGLVASLPQPMHYIPMVILVFLLLSWGYSMLNKPYQHPQHNSNYEYYGALVIPFLLINPSSSKDNCVPEFGTLFLFGFLCVAMLFFKRPR